MSDTPADGHLTGHVSLFRPAQKGDKLAVRNKNELSPCGLFDELFRTGRSNGRTSTDNADTNAGNADTNAGAATTDNADTIG